MRKTCVTLLLVLFMCLNLAACGSGTQQTQALETNEKPREEAQNAVTPQPEEQPEQPEAAAKTVDGDKVLKNVSYVLIYDPYFFDEEDAVQSNIAALYSGDMSMQIVTGRFRGSELEEDPGMPKMVSQKEINEAFEGCDQDIAPGRGGEMDPVYEKGSQRSFFAFDDELENRVQRDFVCVYEGEHCYIWSTDDSISEEQAAEVGAEFDTNIYAKDVEAFGTPRFTENGGKVNIMFYPLPTGYGGFFCRGDIYSSEEQDQAYADKIGLNLDHCIITLNSDYLETNRDFVYSTLAHELQHQICATDRFNFVESPFMRTWLNEAMSAAAEELCYPGIKVKGQYNTAMYQSSNYRKGQSLYNFDTDNDSYIGAYGTVYLFQKYLSEKAGQDVFSKIHQNWRNSYSADYSEAKAIYESVPQSLIEEIDQKYSYPASISAGFSCKEEEWMSKLALDFYLETLNPVFSELGESRDIFLVMMLYRDVNPLDIEGGGRLIVATENGSFTIPEDAGRGLIFIGLDENFNVVSEVYTNAR